MRLITGDCVEKMLELPAESVDAVVTDPPYNLALLGNKWDTKKNYQEWCSMWGYAALRSLKPGGFLVAFGGRRTFHRMIAGLEDATFEIRDCLLWLYSSGFPKGDVLKPAWEPIVLARKSLDGTLWENVTRYGTGALNVTSNQIGGENGRWPANVLLSHDPKCVRAGQLTFPGRKMNRYVDGLKPFGGGKGHVSTQETMPDELVDVWECVDGCPIGEIGPDARFFYMSKPTVTEQHAGVSRGNDHPTVKGIELMRYLVRLVTPAGGTVLDCFLGSGTTAVAALLEQRSFIGIEQDPDYMRIAQERIAFWQQHGEDGWRVAAEKEAAEAKRGRVRDAGQLNLMDLL